jgi:hypothetical protein
MKLVEIKQKWERVPAPDMPAALADFEAHLIAVLRRQKFTICPPHRANDLPCATTSMRQKSIPQKYRGLGR